MARKVYVVPRDVPLEVQAYALARYSRSRLSLQDSIHELSEQRAADFLNTFYFQYGHASIADLAHIALAVENVSILAAFYCLDESLWDGQERSTRYQDFRRPSYYAAHGLGDEAAGLYHAVMKMAFDAYSELSSKLLGAAVEAHPRPDYVPDDVYERALRARVFDVARYLLPLGTLTSFGQITSARTLEAQITRLRSIDCPETSSIATDMVKAAERELPTLLKYTASSPYQQTLLAALAPQAKTVADSVLGAWPPPGAVGADSVQLAPSADVESEIVASLLWWANPRDHSYEQILDYVSDRHGRAVIKREAIKRETIKAAVGRRGEHDPLPRAFRSGYSMVFEIGADMGAMRDLNRHRRAVKLLRGPHPRYGRASVTSAALAGLGKKVFEAGVTGGWLAEAEATLTTMVEAFRRLEATPAALYVLPLAVNARMLMKIDFAEAEYIAVLRSKPTGHFAYRAVAWQMAEAIGTAYPNLRPLIGATNPANDPPGSIFNR
jgi:thymidylate synthase ThyX